MAYCIESLFSVSALSETRNCVVYKASEKTEFVQGTASPLAMISECQAYYPVSDASCICEESPDECGRRKIKPSTANERDATTPASKSIPDRYFEGLSSERINMTLLCFIALPATHRTETCFRPCLDFSYMDIQTRPCVEFSSANFYMIRYRSQDWIGIASVASKKSCRRGQVLNWVRRRKTFMARCLETSASCSFLTSNLASSSTFPIVPHSSSLGESNKAFSRYRNCHAIQCVATSEIIGIAPCDKIQCRGEVEDFVASMKLDVRSAIHDWFRVINS